MKTILKFNLKTIFILSKKTLFVKMFFLTSLLDTTKSTVKSTVYATKAFFQLRQLLVYWL